MVKWKYLFKPEVMYQEKKKKKKVDWGEIKLRIIGFIKVKFIFYVVMQYNSEHNQFLLTGA